MTARDDHRFAEHEYVADAAAVVRYALEHGRAIVVREDGSVRVVIAIPRAELPCLVCGCWCE